MRKNIHYFASGNTARGFYSLFESNLQNLDKIYILKGGPGTGKSTFMKRIAERFADHDIEYIHCSSDNDSIDGVIFRSLKIGLVDGTAPHIIEPKLPGAVEEYINLGEAWDTQTLSFQKPTIIELNNEINSYYEKAYQAFAEALFIHDEWEKLYIENMDFEKADELTDKLITTFYGKMKLNKDATVYHRFLGAATPNGAVDYVPNLTADINKRYFIKGRPGTGKSTMLKKIAAEGEKRGFDLEIYHCGFDPKSLDMVIIRELGLAIFDSTAPHEYFPNRDGDEIIDTYEKLIISGTDELFEEQIMEISGQYRKKMDEAIVHLNKAKISNEELESLYMKAMNFSIVDGMRERIEEQIVLMSENRQTPKG